MRSPTMMKIGLVAMLALAAFGSSQLDFDTSVLDDRGSNTKFSGQDRGVELPGRTSVTDVELVQTHARPLFSQNRRPFVPRPQIVEQSVAVQEAIVEQPVSAPRRLLILGTNVKGSVSSVLVLNQESSETRWLKVGESFDGWTLAAAAPEQAMFICEQTQTADCEYKLALYTDSGGE